jgi:hypothetical protein
MNNEQFEHFLKDTLQRPRSPADDAAAARVLKRLAGPLPRQKLSLRQLPGVLLNWEFAPSWPRMAALACCAAVGFMVGLAGLDRPYDQLDAPFASASRDFGSIFESEPFAGGRP